MKSNLRFSVLISVYVNDNPEFFLQAINSIYNQTLPPNEVVLVVDGPISNKTKDYIKDSELKRNTLKIIWLEENVGHGNAKRIGLEACKNNLVAIMDSDDLCVDTRFEKQIDCFKNNNSLSIVGGSISEFEKEPSNIVGKRVLPLSHEEIIKFLKVRCPMNHMTVMFKKTDVERAGGYLDWFHNEDYYLWIRMYQSGCVFANLNDSLVYARVGKDFYHRRGGWKYFMSEYRLQSYMFSNGIINIWRFFINITIRIIIQILISDKIRAFIFKTYFRKS
jgi:glycosyltransferase involved in cell wall biosynthesis